MLTRPFWVQMQFPLIQTMDSSLLDTKARVFRVTNALPYNILAADPQPLLICCCKELPSVEVVIYHDQHPDWFNALATLLQAQLNTSPLIELVGNFQKDWKKPSQVRKNKRQQWMYFAADGEHQPDSLFELINQSSSNLSAFSEKVESNLSISKEEYTTAPRFPGDDWTQFSTKLPPALISKIDELIADPEMRRRQGWKGQYARMIFVEEALRLHVERLWKEAGSRNKIADWCEDDESVRKIISTKAQRACGQTDDVTFAVLQEVANQHGVRISDLINPIIRDSYRGNKGLWELEIN